MLDSLARRLGLISVGRSCRFASGPAFADKTTTGENLAILIWELLVDKIPSGRLAKVGVVETRDNYFEYAGPAAVGAR